MSSEKPLRKNPTPADGSGSSQIWKLMLLVTTMVLTLTIVPYLTLIDDGGVLRFLAPVVASWLIVYALLRVRKDFALFNDAAACVSDSEDKARTLEIGAIAYFAMLGVVAFMHFLWLATTSANYL